MKRNFISFLFLPILLLGDSNTSYKGNLNLYYASRMSDQKIINLPFRMANLDIQHRRGDLEVVSSLSMEYRLKEDTGFLENSNPQEFVWDLRELYFNWYTGFGEIKVGKQIHNWGMVDENSPMDNANAFDYYYLFNTGKERKLGTLSSALEIYLNTVKLGIIFSPIHNTNRIPINDPDFPITLPVYPREAQTISVKDPYELNLQLRNTSDNFDMAVTYFKGHDRLFNLSGANVFSNQFGNVSVLDTVFGFRETEMLGYGMVTFIDHLALRFEYAHFHTRDKNNDISRSYPNDPFTIYPNLDSSHVFQTDAKYYQLTFQTEYKLPYDITFIAQYFKYDTLSYSVNNVDPIQLPLFELDFEPYDYFYPGAGAPIAFLTQNAFIMLMSKEFPDAGFFLKLRSIWDFSHVKYKPLLTGLPAWLGTSEIGLNHPTGAFYELSGTYFLDENFSVTLVINKSFGDDEFGPDYPFNQLADFSHTRLELKYFF